MPAPKDISALPMGTVSFSGIPTDSTYYPDKLVLRRIKVMGMTQELIPKPETQVLLPPLPDGLV